MDQILLRSLSKHNIFILDFEDSFTYNIAATLENLGKKSLVVSLQDQVTFFEWLDSIRSIKNHKPYIIIFGPGPGHPNDYLTSIIEIKKLLNVKNIFIMGICLGHQLIWKAKGHKIVSAKTKVHGKIRVTSPSLFLELGLPPNASYQRYNSLEIKIDTSLLLAADKLYYDKDSVLWSSFSNGISYQFHPESVGTSCPEIFFRPLLNFLYNEEDECLTNPRRTLRPKSIKKVTKSKRHGSRI